MSKSAEQAANELQAILFGISTKDLVVELSKREGVNEAIVPETHTYLVEHGPSPCNFSKKSRSFYILANGPALILVVK
jgi:hypothetical protein